ncbi:MAG: STAS domain-containing protein [Phycisphaeraceae bacterium]|nr:STAS domain-containing protein [Phycisphaerales bacterium]QOJ18706.1 MAG: STAS domain-containing protein [Phycisphaeraceae bacterium]
MPSSYTTLRLTTDQSVTILTMLDRRLVEPEHVQRVSGELNEAIKAAPHPVVVINFEKTEFLSSSMLGAIVVAQALVEDRRGRLALCGLTPDLRKLFKMMRLDSRVTIHDTRDDAVEALSP